MGMTNCILLFINAARTLELWTSCSQSRQEEEGQRTKGQPPVKNLPRNYIQQMLVISHWPKLCQISTYNLKGGGNVFLPCMNPLQNKL